MQKHLQYQRLRKTNKLYSFLTFFIPDDIITLTKIIKVRDYMIYKNDISSLKEEIGEKIGQKIIVKGSLGRNKPFEEEAVIKETYPNIFVVKYEEHDTNVSYRYTDILTRDLEVSVFDGEGYCPLIPPIQK